ncbi:ABC transporter ATP-binding protein [Actinomadura barringtoniae]|uniref:ABC transporter ATP-binding protein n=1 Tax=Actinomadura barringtoniae TaxID=1427535 RepID=A0A939PTH6_9ACTN|nr:ABC transporter ATP-binding protein [Actinomadura barringtoniae]MBO2454486.1 ABC transporter ATP-binding protein [Actinomadura barringtoniae]
MSLLEISGLTSRYGQVEALTDISFEVGEGEIVALLGSNGAGKTTTLRTISGLHRAHAGRIVFDGADITRLKAHQVVTKGLGHVPEGRRVFAALTVAENLLLGAYQRRRDRTYVAARREEIYEMFPRLGERRAQLAGLMSGGEQQMLAIGRALMHRPRLLALDEPTMGLAPQTAQQVLKVVRDIRDQGTTILIVEQNAHQTLRLADRAYVLESGGIVLDGTGAELAEDPRVKAAYLGGDPVIDTPA